MLFDNETGKLVKSIDLNNFYIDAPFEVSSFTLVLDGPHVLVITKHQDHSYWMLYTMTEKCLKE